MNYSIDSVEIIDKKSIRIQGWIIEEKKKPVLFFTLDGKNVAQIKLSLFLRKDVIEALKLERDVDYGFDEIVEVGEDLLKSEKIEVYFEDQLLYSNMVASLLVPSIRYNVEMFRINNDDNSIEIKGWAIDNRKPQPVRMVIKKGDEVLVDSFADKVRTDVRTALNLPEGYIQCGFMFYLRLRGKNKKIRLLFYDSLGCECEVSLEESEENFECAPSWGTMVKKTFSQFLDSEDHRIKAFIDYWNINWNKYCELRDAEKERNALKIDNLVRRITREEVWQLHNQYTADYRNSLLKYVSNRGEINILLFLREGGQYEKTIESILEQDYQKWNLYILGEGKKQHKNNKIYYYDHKDLSALLAALRKSSLPLLLLTGNITLEKTALAFFAKNFDEPFDIMYSDDQLMPQKTLRFKPGWSPEYILSSNYIGECILLHYNVLCSLPDNCFSYGDLTIYAIVLYLGRRPDIKVRHLEQILCQLHIQGNSEIAKEESGRLLEREIAERGIKAVLCRNSNEYNQIPVFDLKFPDEGPLVDIIIPTKNGYEFLKRCLNSIKRTSYKNYKITVINNESDDERTLRYFDKIACENVKVIDINNKDAFSYSYVNNTAAKQSEAEILLFLNNDTEVINSSWLSQMVGYLLINNVGVVGAKLLFGDESIQHAGIIMGMNNKTAAPAFKLLHRSAKSYNNMVNVTCNYSAVTAACMLIRKADFFRTGMFDETDFNVAYNDLDLCMKILQQSGKTIVYVHDAELLHYEGTTRGYIDKVDETLAFRERYKNYKDPYYNRNLSLQSEHFLISTDNSFEQLDTIRYNPKVLVISHTMFLEGAPLQVFEIVSGVQKQTDMEVDFMSPQEGPLVTILREKGYHVDIFGFDINEKTAYDEYMDSVQRLKNIMLQEKYDIIFANTLETFWGVQAAFLAKIPSIWMIHESARYNEYFRRYDIKIQQEYLKCFSYPYKLVFCSEETRKMFSDADVCHTSETIHNGLITADIDQYKREVSKEQARKQLHLKNEENMVLILGTTCERKGQLDFVEAVNLIEQRGNLNNVYYIVGGREGMYLEKIRELIGRYSLEHKINIVMQTKDVNLYYRACDIFVCASYNESYPRVILEAMAFGIPIVTTSVFGIKEQVVDGVNGYMFEPGDYRGMAEAVCKLTEHREIYGKFSENAYKVLKLINSYDEMIESFRKILVQLWLSIYYKK